MTGIVRRVGILEMAGADPLRCSLWETFTQRLHDLGWVEGESIAFDFRWADGHEDRLAAAAAELIGNGMDVLVTTGTPAADLASRTTSTLPIVMATGTAPDAARANVAGVIDLPPGLSARRLALLHEATPDAACLAVLLDENSSSPRAIKESRKAAGTIGISLKEEYAEAGGFLRLADPRQLPARRPASGQNLAGAKPADLPGEAPSEYELVVNRKIVAALGFAIPDALLRQAIVIG